MHTLEMKDLNVEVEGKQILFDFSLTIHSGEIHAIMGPNGAGKSTLSKVIMGDPQYHILSGSITYDGEEITTWKVDERARLGIFLAMQMPPEIEGVTNADFMRSAVHAKEQDQFQLFPFVKQMNQMVEELEMDSNMIHRSINQGFSGGERKKNEILQMYLLKPKMVLLDEIDSGLDVDSLKIVGTKVMQYYEEETPGILLITHYKRLLELIQPTHVHIMMNGKIVESGDFSLVSKIETEGYQEIKKKSATIGTCIVKETMQHE